VLSKRKRLPVGQFSGGREPAFKGKWISIKVAGNSLGIVRIGVLVGKRVGAKASTRNALKRVVYMVAGDHIGDKLTGKDLLVILEAPIMEFDSDIKEALRLELIEGLEKVKHQ
jgi:ribonuclease P protein component